MKYSIVEEYFSQKVSILSPVWWYMPVIPVRAVGRRVVIQGCPGEKIRDPI
jgi:hypothetical protein